MNIQSLFTSVVAGSIACFGSMANASLIGDEITAKWIFGQSEWEYVFVVSEGVDLASGFTLLADLDVEATSIAVEFTQGTGGINPGLRWEFLDLDLGSDILGVSVTTNYVGGWSLDNISFTASSVIVDFEDGASFTVNEDVFQINLQTASTVVPLPAAAWLFGSAVVGLYGVRKTQSRIAS